MKAENFIAVSLMYMEANCHLILCDCSQMERMMRRMIDQTSSDEAEGQKWRFIYICGRPRTTPFVDLNPSSVIYVYIYICSIIELLH